MTKEEKYHKIYQFFKNIFKFERRVRILPVNFDKPWWNIIWEQKKIFGTLLILESVQFSFHTLIPLIAGWVISQQDLNYFFLFIGVWAGIMILSFVSIFLACLYEPVVMFSINYHGQKYFLTTDPIYHATRSSGEIISKLDRAWRSYEDFLDILSFEIIKIVISLITVAVTFLYFDLWLGLISLTFFLLIAIAGIGGSVSINKFTVPEWIKEEDKLKDTTVETLQQAQHIRSVFASDQQMKKVEKKNKNMITMMATVWYTHHTYELFVRYLYLASVAIIGYVIYSYINSGKIDPTIGISLLVTYILGSTDILWIGQKVQRLTESGEKARDLFTYVKKFGRQSYPVLEGDKQK